MEGTSSLFGTSNIVHDYERDPVYVELRATSAALEKQVQDLQQQLAFVEGLFVKRLSTNFDAAVKDMCALVKKDPELLKNLQESLRSQNTPSTRKLLEYYLAETAPEEGFVVCNRPLPPTETQKDPASIRDELTYVLGKMKETLPPDTTLNIQDVLESPANTHLSSGLDIGAYALTTLKITWTVSRFLYKETLRLGTAALAATPLILFCVLVNEINKLSKGWIFKTATSGLKLAISSAGWVMK